MKSNYIQVYMMEVGDTVEDVEALSLTLVGEYGEHIFAADHPVRLTDDDMENIKDFLFNGPNDAVQDETMITDNGVHIRIYC